MSCSFILVLLVFCLVHMGLVEANGKNQEQGFVASKLSRWQAQGTEVVVNLVKQL